MPYRFVRERTDYAAFASGQVFHSAPGRTAFPVRLASEVFQRCAARLADDERAAPYVLYDPCCGSAQLLAALAFLHGEMIETVIASDIDPDAVRLAERNLALLTMSGLESRVATLRTHLERYGKASHAEALDHALSLQQRLTAMSLHHSIKTRLFQADALDPVSIRQHVPERSVDLVITDIPHGHWSAWQAEPESPVWSMLESLRPILAMPAVVAVAARKGQQSNHEAYRRVDRLQIGKRRVDMFMVDAGIGLSH